MTPSDDDDDAEDNGKWSADALARAFAGDDALEVVLAIDVELAAADGTLADPDDAAAVARIRAALRERARTVDVLDVLEGMGAHLHEHHSDMLAWPWRLFCAKWARTMVAGVREKERTLREKEQREETQQRMALARAHQRQWGAATATAAD